MLTLLSSKRSHSHYCDRLSRRNFLSMGTLGFAGLTLPELLRAEAEQGKRSSHKSVIMIYLCGGPPHQDMYDIKTEAPAEIRGEFSPIDTNVPGVQISEYMPHLAKMMDKLIPIRTMVGAKDCHCSHQCMTGQLRPPAPSPAGGWPSVGSVASHFQGSVSPGVPPFVSLCYTTKHQPYNEPGPGFLGLGHRSFRPTGPSRDDMILQGMTSDRLDHRKALLKSLDNYRRSVDASGAMAGMDVFNRQAFGILTSSELFNALDISSESQSLRDRYGTDDETKPKGDGAPRVPQNFLVARRLVEAGVRVVTINYSFWDWHGNNFKTAKTELPIFEKAFSALIEDLHERNMSEDVAVIAWGEFGRTPKINKNAGRDHWPRVSCALLAGGTFKTGQTIGETDRLGGEAIERPVTFPEVYASLYHHLEIDLHSERLFDFRGRPVNLLGENVQPLSEII